MIEHNGKLYARVSDVLRTFSDFSHIDPNVLAAKTHLGVMVHDAIASEINEEFPILESTDQWNYFKSFLAWRERLKPQFSQSEKRYYCNDKLITGQIDALAFLGYRTGLPVLIDFKTSAQESKEVWPMQAHMYRYLLEKNGVEVHPSYLFVKLNKKGELPEVFQYAWDPNIHNKCMNAIDKFWETDKK